MLPLIAILLPVMILLMGFAVDLSYMQNVRTEMRAATDVSARAAATELAKSDDTKKARNVAKQIARRNKVANEPLTITDSDIEFGRSEANAQGRYVFANGKTPFNSVRVTSRRTTSSAAGGVSLFFGGFSGVKKFQPVQSAVATFLNVDICLVLDRSTSMKLDMAAGNTGMYTNDPRFCAPPAKNTRWAALASALDVFTNTLRDTLGTEKVGVASYGSDMSGYGFYICGSEQGATSLDCALTDDLSVVDNRLDTLSSTVWNGNTYIEGGMRVGLQVLQDSKNARTAAEKVMIVLTDGYENVGSARAAAADIAAAGITIHAVSFSSGADTEVMSEVAQIGKGRYYNAPDGATLEKAFLDLAAQMSRITE